MAERCCMDIDDVLRWMNSERYDDKGGPYAGSTQASVRSRLNSAMRAAGTDDLSVLANMLPYPSQVKDLYSKLRATSCKEGSSVGQVHWALKHLHAYAVDAGAITGDWAVKRPSRGPKKPMNVYTQDQVALAVETARAKGLRWWAFMATIAHSGRRSKEVLDLRWDTISLEDPEDPYFDLQYTKAGRQQYVPLDEYLYEKVFTPENIALLKSERQGTFHRPPAIYPFPWKYGTALGMWRNQCEAVGIPYHGLHWFRHTFATYWIGQGEDNLIGVSRLLGHARIETTASLYDHGTARNYRKLMNRKPKPE